MHKRTQKTHYPFVFHNCLKKCQDKVLLVGAIESGPDDILGIENTIRAAYTKSGALERFLDRLLQFFVQTGTQRPPYFTTVNPKIVFT